MNRKIIGWGAVLAFLAAVGAGAVELAQVNGRPITDRDLRMALSGLTDGQRSSVLRDPNSRREVISGIIDQQVLYNEALKERMDQDAGFKQALEAFRKQYLASHVLMKHIAPEMTDAAAHKFYEAHKDRYNTDEVHAMHILLPDEEEAREALKKAKAPGADFQALAEKLSRDPSAKNNRGDLGFFTRDQMVPSFSEAAFGARVGEIIGPIKSPYGYHIIKVVQKKVGKTLGYDEVELRVKNDLRQALATNYMGKLRKASRIVVNDQAIAKLPSQ